ncbi:CYTH and CHAD domain-containing protein [Jatrophihabitans sp. DSM 45814]
MTESYIERELKFDVEAGFAVPAVDALLPAGGRMEHVTERLRSDYFDTADRALLQAHITLRRRTGTTDTGWQLKIPHEPFREEIRVQDSQDGDGSVPPELRDLLLGVSLDRPLIQIATLRTERAVTRLLDVEGRRLAEIDDDTVRASAAGDSATASSWREIEVELGENPVELLQALGRALRRAGAHRSTSSSKLSRALPEANQVTRPNRKPRAGDITAAYIREQQRMIIAGDIALRRGDESVIHKTRVATRRLRSTLRTFAVLFDSDRAAVLDDELRWYGGLLGEVRDRQVLTKRLDRLLEGLDETLVLGPVKTRIDTTLRAEQGEHWQTLQEAMSQPRYLSLLADIAAWVADPPLQPKASGRPNELTRLVDKAERKVARRLRHANATGDVHRLHAARKAAKRARYAAEAAEPVIGRKASAKQAGRYQKLQDLLGEHQDSIVSAELLRRLGAKAGTARGENGFTFGILHEREQQNAIDTRDKARRIAKKYS